ncbi:hypothetical protein F8S13_14585 [Chloroflexia bacterium SDU3-3]|nr:hypothetical protein F8S13_14585 [Chloroflexia bacterium SDU3-3]
MRFNPPEWHLRERCPCCTGQGELLFIACPACGGVLLVCDEIGLVYPAASSVGAWTGLSWLEDDRCPSCDKVRLADFPPASSDQILALGIQYGEYV